MFERKIMCSKVQRTRTIWLTPPPSHRKANHAIQPTAPMASYKTTANIQGIWRENCESYCLNIYCTQMKLNIYLTHLKRIMKYVWAVCFKVKCLHWVKNVSNGTYYILYNTNNNVVCVKGKGESLMHECGSTELT